MPKNVMKLLKPSPHRSRNDFDLSHRHVYTANFGELLPSTCIETVPGDHITLHASNLLRALPMVTSPFLRAKQHIDVWFVPYRDLWHNFDAFITQRDQPVSSALNAKPNYCPHVNLYDLWNASKNANSEITEDIVGQSFQKGSEKLLNLLGYGYSLLGESAETQVEVNPFRLLAYNYIWYNEYRQKYYDDGTYGGSSSADASNAAALFNVDALTCDTLANASIDQSVLAYYKNARLQMRYRTWKKDLYTGLMPSTQFGAVSAINLDGDFSSLTLSGSGNAPVSGNVFADRLYDASGRQFSTGYLNLSGLVGEAALYSPELALGNNSPSRVVLDIDASNVGSAGEAKTFTGFKVSASDIASALSVSGTGSVSGFDMLALRKAEAVQIWRENALRAGNRVADNMRAHYGVESDFRDHRPVYLGSVSSPLNIGDVMSTASTGVGINDSVGDIAGKGLSSLDEKVFTFDAKDFGVIMAISSILPEAEYNAQGVDRLNQLLEAEDFFVPEYENLGLEAVSSQNFLNTTLAYSKVVGYAPRYYGYKTKLDKCFGSFMSYGINAPWCSPKYDVYQAMLVADTALPLSTLYVNPKIFDVNFSVSVDNVDQFLCDFYYDVDAVRPMSVVGLPFS